MDVKVDPQSVIPPFEQVRIQVRDLVTSGKLVPGARLPTVRTLAGDLQLAPNTVARAYRELETDGVIETRGRNGTFVSSHGDPTERLAQEAASTFADRIRVIGFDAEKAVDLAAAALRVRSDD